MQDWQQGKTGAVATCAGQIDDTPEFGQFLEQARFGSGEAIGALLSQYRDWLHRTAERELCSSLQARVTAADVVQETFLNAHLSFPAFRGQCAAELAGLAAAASDVEPSQCRPASPAGDAPRRSAGLARLQPRSGRRPGR